ncbi:hypothetical protein V1264_011566 [Littorina saxatilis]|uniref:Cadherin domain-containing protein n=2 Tax=Littorina saxatilis TaxID=31220 RepID=A0AAN9GKM4_9CAEN
MPFTISAKFFDSEVDAVFNTLSRTFGSEAVMNITLAQPLDYETRTSYSFELIAADQGGLNNTALVKVDVIDVQDTPPIFLLRSYRAAIRENEPAGTYVIKVSAEDGDRDPPNDISYSIVSGNPDYFTMDNMTGEITSQVILDRDNFTLVGSEGFFQLVVRASEIPGTTPQYGNTTTDVTVVVVVEDVNDNTPTFASSAPYTAYIREDVAVDSLIYFAGDGYISVSDADQGRNSHFNLTVERDGLPWPMLEATPSDVFSEAVVLLRVLNADVFRNAADTQLTIQLVAREMSTGERYSSTAEVVIAVAKMEEQPTTPLPIVDNSTTASDVVVFIIGFLVIFNIAATVFIVWFLRRRSPEPKQGLVRKGSKYYVNGVETTVRSSGFQDGSAVTLRPESIMMELEGKDRCDVVPLSAVRNENKRLSQASSALSSKANGFQRNSSGPSCDMGDGSGNTERKVLVANEVSPATKSVKPKIVITKADVTSSATGSPNTTTTTTTTTSTASPLPDFSKAKRNVSTPQNPSLSFANPPTTTSASSSTASFQLAPAAFPSANAAAPTATTTTTTSAADATASSTVEPVTRFSAKGAVSTTVTSVPDYVTVSTVSRSSNDASARASTKAEGGESMSEMLY